MRIDNAGLGTSLLAATTAWAVLALLLALFGMGGRITALPEDMALLKPLAVLTRPAPERLGPSGQYAKIISRPLFADDRRPHPFFLQPEGREGEAKAEPFDYVLTSVMITPAFKMAIIRASDGSATPLRIKLGEAHKSLPNWRLESLSSRSAAFIGPEGERQLDLRVYNGVGGEVATVMSAPVANQSPADSSVKPDSTQAMAVSHPIASASPSSSRQTPSTQLSEQERMEAIRQRIEARRAQLRREANQQKPP